ncbi:hypothetical protein [Mycolicibacterium sp.]|mgnify:CR=1 FL=1|uniref:hypothetical protein n=1 Tax=Mycolicibacterium sp. TaxID=2320850 RepID=UPI0025FF778F|nr:hypothetical protein [Mycolicibacterium sp.]
MTMNAAEHWQAWLERWGDAYDTDEERRAAYRDAKANLARLTEAAADRLDRDRERGEQEP